MNSGWAAFWLCEFGWLHTHHLLKKGECCYIIGYLFLGNTSHKSQWCETVSLHLDYAAGNWLIWAEVASSSESTVFLLGPEGYPEDFFVAWHMYKRTSSVMQCNSTLCLCHILSPNMPLSKACDMAEICTKGKGISLCPMWYQSNVLEQSAHYWSRKFSFSCEGEGILMRVLVQVIKIIKWIYVYKVPCMVQEMKVFNKCEFLSSVPNWLHKGKWRIKI